MTTSLYGQEKKDSSNLTGSYNGILPKQKALGNPESYHITYNNLRKDLTCSINDLVYLHTAIICNACNVATYQYEGTWRLSSDTIMISISESFKGTLFGYKIQTLLFINESGDLTDKSNPNVIFRKNN